MGDEATYGIAADRLRSFVERIERLEEEKKAIAGDIKDVYAEAKSAGFNTKVLRRIIAERKLDQHELAEQEQLLDLYKRALGQLRDTPLGVAAVARAEASPAMVKAVRKIQADAKMHGYGLSIQVNNDEPVVIAPPPAAH